MKKLIFLLLLAAPLLVKAQIKDAFQKQRQMDLEKLNFKQKFQTLDSINKKGLVFNKIDSLKRTDKFDFLVIKTKPNGKQLVFDLPQYLATYYLKLEKSGVISHLQKFRSTGQLYVPSREVASDIELPKKTNAEQSYNDFYLQVIQQLIKKHQSELAADSLDYKAYQQWEKEENLQGDAAVTEFRASFIRFLYSHYHFSS